MCDVGRVLRTRHSCPPRRTAGFGTAARPDVTRILVGQASASTLQTPAGGDLDAH